MFLVVLVILVILAFSRFAVNLSKIPIKIFVSHVIYVEQYQYLVTFQQLDWGNLTRMQILITGFLYHCKYTNPVIGSNFGAIKC